MLARSPVRARSSSRRSRVMTLARLQVSALRTCRSWKLWWRQVLADWRARSRRSCTVGTLSRETFKSLGTTLVGLAAEVAS